MKIVIWGMGNSMHDYLSKKGLYKNDTIIAFVDNNQLLWGKSYQGIPILSPYSLYGLEYDCIIICVVEDADIKKQLIQEMKVDKEKIKTITEINNYYTQQVIDKYKDNSDTEIQSIIEFYQKKGLSVFPNYIPEHLDEYEVFRDKENHPYILFEGKKIYYPYDFPFVKKQNGKEYLGDIMYEQKNGSPHLYLQNENIIFPGSVVVDAGTAEGNFAIRFIDKVSMMYLVESDPIWIECLERTFYPFRDKVIICNKSLSRYNSETTITLDSLLKNQKIDFLKMDIEGAEIDALLGAKNTLLKSNVNCAICSYHKMNDEENIRFILESLGYLTQVSNGYMFFLYDENIFYTLDLRKGIVYASKSGD